MQAIRVLVKITADSVWHQALLNVTTKDIDLTLLYNEDLLDHFYQANYDFVFIDMPLLSASVVNHLKRNFSIPIIVLGDHYDEVDLIVSLTLGADDYWTIPLSAKALLTRLQHAQKSVKNVSKNHLEWMTVGEIKLNLYQHEIIKKDEHFTLSNKLYDMLKFFVENPHEIITKEDLYYAVWRERNYYSESNINVNIHRIRSLIEKNPKHPKILKTIRGVGYQFTPHESRTP